MIFKDPKTKRRFILCSYCLEEPLLSRLHMYECTRPPGINKSRFDIFETDDNFLTVAYIHRNICPQKIMKHFGFKGKQHNVWNIYYYTLRLVNNSVHQLKMRIKILDLEEKGWEYVSMENL